ncbi:hypothetical protein COE51_16345 [Bacillus pseudomycoides]|nr:hypothetical protein COE51_16345 [Bacillus pseudomycoides]
MIKNDFMQIKVSKQNVRRYNSLGYKCSVGDEISVKIEDLPLNSKIKIEIVCDYCENTFLRSYCNHNKQSKTNKINKDCCKHCIGKKNAESNMLTYGVEHPMHLQEFKEAQKNTMIEKYGVTHPMHLDSVKQKVQDTTKERYGVDHVMKLDSTKEKIKQTNIEKYGKESYTQTEEYIKRVSETNIEKYGVKNVFQNEAIQDKQKETIILKYGVENVFQHEEIKEKSKQTMMKKYGVEHPMYLKEIKDSVIKKSKKTLYENGTAPKSKQQVYLNELLGGEINYQIESFNLDIAFPDEKIYIEYDGGGHDLQVKMNKISQEELKKEELKRYFILKSKGWKEIRIISPRDYLPNDDILLQELEKAKKWFQTNDNGHWHYHIYLNDKVNDETYGKLRKI